MKHVLLLLLIACTTDVGIITVEKKQEDTSDISEVVDTFQEEINEPTSEPSSEETELSGTVGLVKWELEQIACPSCMGVSQEITVNFEADFHNKINESHPTWVPAQGQCQQSLNYLTINRQSINVGNTINVVGPYNSFQAYKDNSNKYSANIYETQYDRNSLYTIQTNQGNLQFNSIQGFDYIEPMELRYVDPSYAFAARILRTGSTFWWGPSGASQDFNITLAVYSSNGSQLLGYVSCTGADSGMMTIPGNYLSSFPVWSLVAVHMTRYSEDRVPFEGLGGYVDTQMYWSVVGTGHIE